MKIKFKYITLILALSVAGCAAYFSVWGLSQLFAGASTAVIIMATVLEVGKIATTTALHTYWGKLSKGLRIYLTLSVGILMLITSAGIYGFLSNAYQMTANKLEIQDAELSILSDKKEVFDKKVLSNQIIIDNKTIRINQLSSLRLTQETRLDNNKSNRAKSNARGDITIANTEIQKLTNEIDELNIKNGVLSDSISSYAVKSLELNSNSEISGEVGPLKYIAELSGMSMANIVNYMILLIIFVFDPLAVALVIMTNKIFMIESELYLERNYNISTPNLNKESLTNSVEGGSSDIRKKIELQDIKEIRESNRGFSVNIPKPANSVERIGSNKILKDGDNNKVYYNRGYED